MSYGPETLQAGMRVVETAGKPVRLVDEPMGTLPLVEVEVLPSNTADSLVYVGGPEVYAGEGNSTGYRGRGLQQRTNGSDVWSYGPIDPFFVWIDAENDGDGVSYLLYGVNQGI